MRQTQYRGIICILLLFSSPGEQGGIGYGKPRLSQRSPQNCLESPSYQMRMGTGLLDFLFDLDYSSVSTGRAYLSHHEEGHTVLPYIVGHWRRKASS